MPIDLLLDAIPAYAHDLKLNLATLFSQPELSAQQAWGTALSCAVASRSRRVAEAIEVEAAQHMDARSVSSAKAAAAYMATSSRSWTIAWARCSTRCAN